MVPDAEEGCALISGPKRVHGTRKRAFAAADALKGILKAA